MSDETLPYRPCAGVMLANRDGRVFVGQRLDSSSEAWQMPQGGIDLGEDAEEAAIRQRAFADDLQPRGGPAPRQPLGREGDVIEGEFEHRDSK